MLRPAAAESGVAAVGENGFLWVPVLPACSVNQQQHRKQAVVARQGCQQLDSLCRTKRLNHTVLTHKMLVIHFLDAGVLGMPSGWNFIAGLGALARNPAVLRPVKLAFFGPLALWSLGVPSSAVSILK